MCAENLKKTEFIKQEILEAREIIIQGLKERVSQLIDKRLTLFIINLSQKFSEIAQMLDPRIKDRNTEFPEIFQRSVLNWMESLDNDNCIAEVSDEVY